MDTDSGAPAGRSALSYGSEGRPSRGGLNGQVSYTQRLTNLLTRPAGTGETTRDTGDARRGLCLVSETGRNVGDRGDARRSAHNPEVEGSNPSPATRQNGPRSIASGAVFLLLVTRLLVTRASDRWALPQG